MANRYCKNFIANKKSCKAKSNPQGMFDFMVFKDCDAGMIESDICLACYQHAFKKLKDVPTITDENTIPCKICLFNIMNQLTCSAEESFAATEAQYAFGAEVFKALRSQEWGGLLDDPDMAKFRSRSAK
jgi:hypothetical protein